jgi:hypothetical protein
MATDAAADWLAVVDDDLRQVVNNLYGPMPSLIGAAYHCQQAAEKLVKAVLVEASTAFPKTHDIAALVGFWPSHQGQIAQSRETDAIRCRVPVSSQR